MKDWAQDFLEKAKKKFPQFDYSKVNYVNAHVKVEIVCKEHGSFWITPNGLLTSKYGCPKCSLILHGLDKRSNTEEFIKKCKQKFPEKEFDYSKVDYIKSNTKVIVGCPIHGEFLIRPNQFLKSGCCPRCSKPSTQEDFILAANRKHNYKYDYSKVHYINSNTRIIIGCPKHGDFEIMPQAHLSGHGCQKCGHETTCSYTRSNTKDFIEKAKQVHGDKYDYSLVEYINNHTPVKIICPIHGIFEQTPQGHLAGKGCLYCKESKGEKEVASLLDKNNIQYERQKKIRLKRIAKLTNLIFVDFYIPGKEPIIIEYNGEQHYKFIPGLQKSREVFKRQFHRDEMLREYCQKAKIKLIEISYLDNIEKKLKDANIINNGNS